MEKFRNALRPIVSSMDSVMYQLARYLADILSPLVGKNRHFIKNSLHFVDKVKGQPIGPDEEMVSYDVSALFTSVSVDRALEVVKRRLESDPTFPDRTTLNIDEFVKLLDMVVSSTYFTYDGQFYRQIHGAAMGSPVSPILCNLYMEDFETAALNSAPHKPAWWFRYVDDTHTKQKKEHDDSLYQHISQQDEHIKFTTEHENEVESKPS